jgi:hypothetical protein
MPLTVEGKIRDDGDNFYAYRLVVYNFNEGWKEFERCYYHEVPLLLNDSGTGGYPTDVVLGQLDIPAVYGKKEPAGGR